LQEAKRQVHMEREPKDCAIKIEELLQPEAKRNEFLMYQPWAPEHAWPRLTMRQPWPERWGVEAVAGQPMIETR
jgi:hypothetical protein